MREQNGVFRVNCIDCLDRTNVVESALGRHVLATQLTQVGMTPDTLTSDIEFVYNDGEWEGCDKFGRLGLTLCEWCVMRASLGQQW